MNKTDNIHTARCYASCTTYLASEAQPGTQFGGGKPLDSGLRRNDEWSSPRRRPGSRTAVAKPLDSGLRRNDEGLSPRRRPGSSTAEAKPLDSGLRRNDEGLSPRRRPGSRTAVAKPLDSGLRRNDDAALSPTLSRAREREKGGRNDEVNLRHQPATAPAYHRRLSCLPG